MKIKTKISILLAFLFISCSFENDALEYAYKVAGPNSGELEAVMNHYRNDSLKLAAARFLIENMPGHYSYKSKEIDKYYEIALELTKSGLSPKEQSDSLLHLSESRFFGLDHELIQDARIISSEFLIQNIDKAFDAWKNERWAQHISFDEFCEWILPYKCVELQSFDCWRDTMRAKFTDDINRMEYDDECYDSPFRAVNVIRGELCRKIKPYGIYTKSGYPMMNASTISSMTYGTCADYVHLGVLTYRSLGIPVVIDETPSWGRYRAGHSWYTLLNDHGEEMPSEWDISSCPGSPFFPYQRIPKVFRRTYAINRERVPYYNNSKLKYPFNLFSKDVTDHYIRTSDIEMEIRSDAKLVEDFAYIAIFNGHEIDWSIIDYGTIRNGKVCFHKMGRNILYIVLGYDGNSLVPLSSPFIIQKDGKIEWIEYNDKVRESILVKRKYYSSENLVAMKKRIVGGRIQCSNNSNFHDAKTLLTIDNVDIPDKIPIDCNMPYRFWRYLSPNGSFGDIAELAFFENDSTILNGRIIHSESASDEIAYKAFDNDWLSNFETGEANGNWVGMDFNSTAIIKYIRVVPRGDDNDIHPGDRYELKYWNGFAWVLHQTKVAQDNSIEFDNVPSSALFWVHDCTRGWDERLFRYNLGKIEWW